MLNKIEKRKDKRKHNHKTGNAWIDVALVEIVVVVEEIVIVKMTKNPLQC